MISTSGVMVDRLDTGFRGYGGMIVGKAVANAIDGFLWGLVVCIARRIGLRFYFTARWRGWYLRCNGWVR